MKPAAFADAPLDIPDLPDRMLVRRDIDLHGEVDAVDVDEAVAERTRHRAVELDDHRARRAVAEWIASTEVPSEQNPLGVGRRRIHQDRVEMECTRREQVRARPTGRPGRSRPLPSSMARRALGPMNSARCRI